jgi:hypothetical protein
VALKSENMHLFFASLETAVLATVEVILLVVQILLRTERWTYLIYALYLCTPGIYFPNVLSGRRRNEFHV